MAINDYEIDTLELIKAMEHEMYDQGDARHEMWNHWTWDPSPTNTAIRCKDEGLKIIGYFYLPNPSYDLDIGVVAEYEDGDRIWCHAKKSWYDSWKKWFPDLYKKIGVNVSD